MRELVLHDVNPGQEELPAEVDLHVGLEVARVADVGVPERAQATVEGQLTGEACTNNTYVQIDK